MKIESGEASEWRSVDQTNSVVKFDRANIKSEMNNEEFIETYGYSSDTSNFGLSPETSNTEFVGIPENENYVSYEEGSYHDLNPKIKHQYSKKCKNCKKSFNGKKLQNYESHMMVCFKEPKPQFEHKYQCSICMRSYPTNTQLKAHMKYEMAKKTIKPNTHNVTDKSAEKQPEAHLDKNREILDQSYGWCPSITKSKKEKSGRKVCEKCFKMFNGLESYLNHIKGNIDSML